MTWLSRMFGGNTMQTLSTGSNAPDFTLPMMDNSTFSLKHALSRGPVLCCRHLFRFGVFHVCTRSRCRLDRRFFSCFSR